MPNRRRYRGPRRPPGTPGEGAPGDSPPQPRLAQGEVAVDGNGGEEGTRPGGPRRRRRRGRGPRPEGALQTAEGDAGVEAPSEPRPLARAAEGAGEGDEPARRRRRRRGRGRRSGEPGEADPVGEEIEGELPSDYIALQVERGMPVLFQPSEVQVDDEPARPSKSKRVNAGKLFWYIRSKSYVPIPELRRRFEITPDEMGTIDDENKRMYIGLPQDVADVVATLRRQQKIGIECSVDFSMPVVIGVYPLNHA